MQLLDGKETAQSYQQKVQEFISNHRLNPCLQIIMIGDNPASQVYVGKKQKLAEQTGIHVLYQHFSQETPFQEVLSFIKKCSAEDGIDGILLQLPVPLDFDGDILLEAIAPAKDVDGLTWNSLGRLYTGNPSFIPCTPLGCMRLIKTWKKDLCGLDAVVIGRSRLVGKPMASLLLEENCTVTQVHSFSKDIHHKARQADILVVAVGRAAYITQSMIKPGACVVDVGINVQITSPERKRHIVGDVCFPQVSSVAGALSPVPGGVGPMTIVSLLTNTVKAHIIQKHAERILLSSDIFSY